MGWHLAWDHLPEGCFWFHNTDDGWIRVGRVKSREWHLTEELWHVRCDLYKNPAELAADNAIERDAVMSVPGRPPRPY
jgi:hypothetical protein